MSSWEDSAEDSAQAAASSVHGNTWSDYQSQNQVAVMVDDGSGGFVQDTDADGVLLTEFSSDATYQNETDWQDAYSSSYSTAYNNAYSESASGASRVSDSQVTVTGIGSDAMVSAAATSTFDVLVGSAFDDPADADANASASGTAGANLSTASFANASVQSTASAFMQSFGGI